MDPTPDPPERAGGAHPSGSGAAPGRPGAPGAGPLLRQLDAIFENLPVAVLVVERSGQIAFANARAEEILGLPREEIARRTHDAPEWHIRTYEGAEVAHEQLAARRVLATGEPVYDVRYAVARPDGQDVLLSVNGAPLRDDAPGTDAVVLSMEDVTERRRMHNTLRLTQFSVDRTADPVFWIGPDAHFLYVNDSACASLGYSRDELLEMRVYDVDPTFDPYRWRGHWEKLKRDGSVTVEGEHRSKDGRRYPVEVRANYLEYNGQEYNFAFAHDITDRKRAEAERRQIEERMRQTQNLESLGVLAGGIAHDFNNILMGIFGHAELALMELPGLSPLRGRIDQIRKAAMRAAELSQQMLAYSGKGRFVVQALSITDLVRRMEHLIQASVSKKAKLRYRLGEDPPAIEADAAQMRQVVMNLVTNASEALGEGDGEIAIETGVMHADPAYLAGTYLHDDLPPGRHVFLEVSDTGSGMDEETQARVFEPFFTTKFAGRGLGLPAVLGIVRGHHGAIRIRSRAGDGTAVRVLFPCCERPAAPASGHGLHQQQPPETNTILVVDDEDAVREVAETALRRFGFSVLTAADGQAGLEIFRERADEISLVLLDLTMPRMDGEEAFREIRRLRPDARVIVTSGYNEQVIAERFAGEGLSGFIQKPFRLAALMAKVREALGE